ncbi:MAG: FAD-dependent oxidoreductase [Bacteroidales bacterium]
MLAKKYLSEVVSIENPFMGIYTLEFKSLERLYKYDPGQFLHIAIDTDYDGIGQWPESRCFSMKSNPNDITIKITYAVKGKFTKLMEDQLKVGSKVWLKLPYGDLFTQDHSKESTVFIAGGTGITPYLSLFNNELFNEYINPRIYLGFRSKGYNIYVDELNDVCNLSKSVFVFYQDTDGVIDIDLIFKENGLDANYFISGPPVMIKNFKCFLLDQGVSADNILTDDWE